MKINTNQPFIDENARTINRISKERTKKLREDEADAKQEAYVEILEAAEWLKKKGAPFDASDVGRTALRFHAHKMGDADRSKELVGRPADGFVQSAAEFLDMPSKRDLLELSVAAGIYTVRERQVAEGVKEGKTQEAIGFELGIDQSRVCRILQQFGRKFDAFCRDLTGVSASVYLNAGADDSIHDRLIEGVSVAYRRR